MMSCAYKCSVASGLGLHCLPMSHKKDAFAQMVKRKQTDAGGGGGGGGGNGNNSRLLSTVLSQVRRKVRENCIKHHSACVPLMGPNL